MIFNYNVKLIQQVVKETKKAVIGLLLLSFVLIWIYFEYITIPKLLFWSLLQAIFIYLRYQNAKQLKKYLAENNAKKIRYHIICFFIMIIYSAIVWNIGIIYMTYITPSPYEFIGFIVTIGLITAGTLSILPIFAAFIIYFLMLIIPQIIIISNYNTPVTQGFLLLSLIYIPTIYLLSKSIYTNSINSIINQEKLEKNSITDSLTNIYNRGFFIESAEKNFKIANRENSKLSFLMIDIDNFKNINDTFGHHCGDFVLTELTKIIKNQLRESDLFARLGGEEFGILLLNTSNKGAIISAEKICTMIREYKFMYEDKTIKLTISIGISQNNNFTSFENQYKEADFNLYKAKELGRDQIIQSS